MLRWCFTRTIWRHFFVQSHFAEATYFKTNCCKGGKRSLIYVLDFTNVENSGGSFSHQNKINISEQVCLWVLLCDISIGDLADVLLQPGVTCAQSSGALSFARRQLSES